jgi:hypothetical protein
MATEAAPRGIHAALLLTGAEQGRPVQFAPQFQPPTGSPIAIEVLWSHDGKPQRTDARQWVWDEKTKKALDLDWVFAGSMIFEDPVTKKSVYAADEGDLITVANFGSSILDLPIASPADNADRFSARTDKIPPRDTEVFVTLTRRPNKVEDKTQKRGNGGP